MTLLLAADWRRKEEGGEPGCYDGLLVTEAWVDHCCGAAFCLCLLEIGEEHGEIQGQTCAFTLKQGELRNAGNE